MNKVFGVTDYDMTPVLLIGGIGFAFLFLAITFVVRLALLKAEEGSPKYRLTGHLITTFVLFGLVLLIITACGYALGDSAERRDLRDAQKAWVESHGLTAQPDTVQNLRFPTEVPSSDKEYGLAQVTENKQVVTVHLVWEDGEFVLYGTDGEPLERLEAIE